MIADAHAHYNDAAFDGVREDIIVNAVRQCGIIVNAGVDEESSRGCALLAERYGGLYAAVGIHPQHRGDVSALAGLCAERKTVAVGETGLDYRDADVNERQRQRELFIAQIQISKSYNLPLVIHCVNAWGDMTDILRRYRPFGIMHGFTGSAEAAAELVRMGMYISFGGRLTYDNAKKAHKALLAVPDDRLLLETDAPFGPAAGRMGERSGWEDLGITAAFAARMRRMTEEDLVKTVNDNTARIYEI